MCVDDSCLPVEQKIRQKARSLGIEKCGVIKPEDMLDYADKLRERMSRIPDGEAVYGRFVGFADVRRSFPWAKSIVVAVTRYGRYVIPEAARARYGKSYLTDSRFNPDSPERKILNSFGAYLEELGLKTAFNEHPGLTAMRWAAHKAGLGIIRRNNFFYTEKGSWHTITAWITDGEMELTERHDLKECPSDCNRCIKACPTKSLSMPYTMNMATCVSKLTTSNDQNSYDDATNGQIGAWIYGCDACQDACPMNRDKWSEADDFPGLEDLSPFLSPEKILAATYEEIERVLSRKFFYINKESLWRWKLNAINAMVNDYRNVFAPLIENALRDEYPIVRERAKRALEKII
ncbi:Fe-S oxidoreductase [Synergistales bacterium]|nr:Fe-S oxidoreductase [Synergistales bacterium]